MKAVLQRVSSARVTVEGQVTGSIARGILVFVGITHEDTPGDAEFLADRIVGLRIFPDEAGKMNRNLVDVGGALLVVSQFTLYGDCTGGRRPSFDLAAPPGQAQVLYDHFVANLRDRSIIVATGVFQAMMSVELVNDGPVTFVVESKKQKSSSFLSGS